MLSCREYVQEYRQSQPPPPEPTHASYMREYRKSHPLTPEQRRRDICRSYLNVYLRRGKIQRGPCAVCGEESVEAHHEDYSKPLEVVWLCRRHHVALTSGKLTLFHPKLASGAEGRPSHQ